MNHSRISGTIAKVQRTERAALKLMLLFLVIHLSGLLWAAPPSLLPVLHSAPSLALAGIVAVCSAVLAQAALRRETGTRRPGAVCLHAGVLLLCLGLFVSRVTHFSGDYLMFEGQTKAGALTDYVPGSVYAPGKAAPPALSFSLGNLAPVAQAGAKKLDSIKANITTYGSGTSGKPAPFAIGKFRPLLSPHALVRITDFGYGVRHRISDAGVEQDAGLTALKLFPPGQEDFFVPFRYGYTIYLRLYPDFYLDQKGAPANRSAELRNPLLHVRVSRNKDIMFNDYLQQTETVLMDGLALQFPEIVKWAQFRVVRDPGVFLAVPALALLVLGGALLAGKPRVREPELTPPS